MDDYEKPIDKLQKEGFFSKLKNKSPEDDEITRTKETIKVFDNKNREDLNKIYLKSDLIFLADVFEKFVKLSTKEYEKNLL